MFASTQSVLLSGLQRSDASTLWGMIMAANVGALVYALKTTTAGMPLSDDPATWIAEGIDRAGMTGWLFDANNTIEKMTGNRIGVRAVLGAEPSSRYSSRNQVGALFGPSFGLAADVWKVGGDIATGNVKPSTTHAIRRMIPYQNFFLLRPLLNKAEEGVNKAFGIQ